MWSLMSVVSIRLVSPCFCKSKGQNCSCARHKGVWVEVYFHSFLICSNWAKWSALRTGHFSMRRGLRGCWSLSELLAEKRITCHCCEKNHYASEIQFLAIHYVCWVKFFSNVTQTVVFTKQLQNQQKPNPITHLENMLLCFQIQLQVSTYNTQTSLL
jgi:hypothetical protein